MIVCNFDIVGVAIMPFKANSPLIVYPNTVLTFAVTMQWLESISRRNPQVLEGDRSIEHS